MRALFSRFGLAAKAAVSAFASGSAPSGAVFELRNNRSGVRRYTSDAALESAHHELPWFGTISGRIADSVACRRFLLHKASGSPSRATGVLREVKSCKEEDRSGAIKELARTGDLQPIERHPLLTIANAGNDLLGGFAQRAVTSSLLDSPGECYWGLEINKFRVPYKSWAFPKSWCEQEPTRSDPFWTFSHGEFRHQFKEENVLRFHQPTPINPFGSATGRAVPLLKELETDRSAAKHVDDWFAGGGRPPVVIAGENVPSTPASASRNDSQWLRKALRRLPFWIKGENFLIKELGHTFEAMQLVQLRQFYRDFAINNFGYPPELLGLLGNSNRSTISLALELHAINNVLPRLIRMREVLERLMPRYRNLTSTCVLSFENPVDRDKEFELKASRAHPSSLTENDWRRLQGLPEVPGGDVHLVANRFQAYDRLDQVELHKEPSGSDEAAKSITTDLLLDRIEHGFQSLEGRMAA